MRYLIQASWDDCGHLSPEAKQELWSALPPYQRDARSKGIPVLGAGRIYGVPEEDVVIPDIPIPDHWPRAYGLDVGWNRTAAIFCAKDREADCLYLYSEHYRGEAEAVIHAEAIKARGKWLRGAIDPSARGRSQVDGRQLFQMYTDLGLDLMAAENAVEAGIYQLLMRMTTGRLKVFKSLQSFLSEFRMYRRDEKGRVVKSLDHLMDALRYVHSVFDSIAKPVPPKGPPAERVEYMTPAGYATGWMG